MDNSSLLSGTLTALLTASLCVLLVNYAFKKPEDPFPPGPEPKPIIGNALDIPLKGAVKVYMEWSRKYNSKILHLNALGQHIVILNSWEDASELFEKRASIYSDRPIVPTMEMVGFEYNLSLFTYGDRWRAHRRMCQQNFNAENAKQYQPVQTRKVHDMLSGLLESPERFMEHNRMLAVSLPLTTMYGYEVKHLEDPAVLAADRAMEIGVQVFSPGGSLVNVFPILKYVPWTWTQRMAKEAREAAYLMKNIPLESLKKDMADGIAAPSLVGNFLEKQQTSGASPEEEDIIFNVANTTYGAASETTMSVTLGFIWLIATHPSVQAKAQAEMDSVLGSAERLPTFDDRNSTPYIEAIYREVLRLCPPLPSALPHVVLVDDWYKGYFLPKGTVVIGNVWGMSRDEEKYEDPTAFKPERFLTPDGQINDDDHILAYGFGRRVCVGKHVASNTLWLTFASILACFDITKKKDANGKEIEINDEVDEVGLLSHKAPFECDIQPRSDAWKRLIEISN